MNSRTSPVSIGISIGISAAIVFVVFLQTPACTTGPNAEQKDRQAVARQQAQYGTAQPIPAFDWSLERDIVVQLYQARNARVATYTVWRSDTGVIEDHCPSIGYPVPYDTSLTNPLKIGWASNQGGAAVIEQAEPNGIYASKNSTSTWVRCVVEVNGKHVEAPIFVESKVTTYPFPVQVDLDTSRVSRVMGTTPSVRIKGKEMKLIDLTERQQEVLGALGLQGEGTVVKVTRSESRGGEHQHVYVSHSSGMWTYRMDGTRFSHSPPARGVDHIFERTPRKAFDWLWPVATPLKRG